MKTHIEYGWARRRERVNELLQALIGDLKKDESLSWSWLKQHVRKAVDLRPGFESNSLHSMVCYAAKKFETAGTHVIVTENSVKYIKRIK